jgi:predicted DCC family thiol-disulfide oxidoreductase YuxK
MPTLLLFDGACGLCRRSVAAVRLLDWRHRVRLRDVARDWDAVHRDYPALRREDCLTEMHLVTPGGRVAAGFDAFRELARVLPLGWLAVPFLYLPGVRAIGRRVYASVARHRRRDECRWRDD